MGYVIMKIAMLGHKRIPSREGGVEIVVEELSKRLVKKGCLVTCYNRKGHHVSGDKYDQEKIDSYKGIEIKHVWTYEKKGLAALTSSFCAAIEAAFSNAEIIHIHAEGPAVMSFIPKLRGKRVIVTIHGLDWKREKWGKFASKYIKFGEKQAVRHADEIIVLSKSVQDYFMTEYGRRTIYIPNGVSRHIIRENINIDKRWGLKKDNYVLYLGRIVPEKGIQYLLEAWKRIKTEKKLVIAGGASDTDEFYEKLRQSSSNVIWTGFVQGEVLEELYSNAYIYCLPSDLEGMPLSLLEAMSYGNCCLVSNIEECVSVVEDKAVIFEKSNIVDLKNKLQYLLDNKEKVINYKNMASEYICNKYDWDRMVDETMKVYKSENFND